MAAQTAVSQDGIDGINEAVALLPQECDGRGGSGQEREGKGWGASLKVEGHRVTDRAGQEKRC